MASFKEKLSKGLTAFNVKSSSFLETNKIKGIISTLENDIKDLNRILGEIVYEAWTKNEPVDMEKLNPVLAQIKGKYELISENEAQIRAVIENEKMILGGTEQVKAAMAGQVVCPKCNAMYDTGVNFCTKCGTKLN